jgi:hypothetical protein
MIIIERYNLSTEFWGPMFWYSIHSATFFYNIKDKKYFKKWFELLPFILPCEGCRNHCMNAYEKGMSPKDEDFLSSERLFKYTYNLHKYINNCLKKQNPTFKTVLNFYKNKINEKFYGPTFWHMLHSVSWTSKYKSSSEETKIIKEWFYITFNIFYPKKTKYIKEIKIPDYKYLSRDLLIKYIYNIHLKINNCIGNRTPSFSIFKDFYIKKTVNFIHSKPIFIKNIK